MNVGDYFAAIRFANEGDHGNHHEKCLYPLAQQDREGTQKSGDVAGCFGRESDIRLLKQARGESVSFAQSRDRHVALDI